MESGLHVGVMAASATEGEDDPPEAVHPGVEYLPASARTGTGIEAWADWPGALAARHRAGVAEVHAQE